jgi:hypothetical protein
MLLAVADLDGDERDDVAVANDFSDSVSVLFGNGDGSVTNLGELDTGPFPIAVAIADFDGDGILDIATADADPSATSTVSVLAGAGGRSFAAAASYAVGLDPNGIAVADLNGDGAPDIATANLGSDSISVLLSGSAAGDCPGDCNSDGSVSVSELITGVNIALELRSVDACAAVDFDANGVVSVAELIRAVNSALEGCPS